MDKMIEASWRQVLNDEFDKAYFKKLTSFVKTEYDNYPDSTFPAFTNIFKAFSLCPLDRIKVVVLGQDPYLTRGHANGLCFSVNEDVQPLPKSLKNIYKEITDDYGVEMPKSGDLTRWASQGVLLLNNVLTVHEGNADSHSGKGWEVFTDAVISAVNANKKGVVYMLWGAKAQHKAANLNEEENLILKSPHPSPLSAYRGFFGCQHFSKANSYLEEIGKSKIEW